MKFSLFVAASALALANVSAPAAAQMKMPGMSMPVPAKPAHHKKAAAKSARSQQSVDASPPKAEPGDENPMSGMEMPQQGATREGIIRASPMIQTPVPASTHASHEMNGALGPYPMTRESSGTAWQPDYSQHQGLMIMSGRWTVMGHGVLNLAYDHQSGPRGADKAFASGMLMGMAQHPLGDGALQFKAMVSPDPVMGARGYPLLLASGETANGNDRLIDRQHPHDFFMELSVSASQHIAPNSSVFVYAGLPGEPAFGPPAFMHREAILDSPEAPITHHWLDSTHISFGVVTGGLVLDRLKLEASRFNGREPDQHRWNIETAPLDSTSIRLSWNPTRSLALQGSWAHFVDPEQLEPGVDQKRWSASLLWADEIVAGWKLAGTLAWGRKSALGHNDDAFAAEASLKHAAWTLFGRAEMTENRELTGGEDGPAHRVGKISLGAVRDFKIAQHMAVGAGGLFALNFVPDGLARSYGGHDPAGVMGFVRLKLD